MNTVIMPNASNLIKNSFQRSGNKLAKGSMIPSKKVITHFARIAKIARGRITTNPPRKVVPRKFFNLFIVINLHHGAGRVGLTR